MISSLENVMTALVGVCDNVSHYEAMDKTAPYVVWAEGAEVASLEADNWKGGQTIEGTIDLFTKDEDDPLMDGIPNALNAARIGWNLNSVQYEDETELIHYEWLFRVRQGYGDVEVPGA